MSSLKLIVVKLQISIDHSWKVKWNWIDILNFLVS